MDLVNARVDIRLGFLVFWPVLRIRPNMVKALHSHGFPLPGSTTSRIKVIVRVKGKVRTGFWIKVKGISAPKRSIFNRLLKMNSDGGDVTNVARRRPDRRRRSSHFSITLRQAKPYQPTSWH